MKIGTIANWLAGIFALAAVIISYELTLKHVTHAPVASWFELGCSEKPTPGSANCAAVLNSPYSVFPPQFENEPPNRIHIPIAFLGLVYYTTLLVWLIGVGRPSHSRRWLHYLALILVALGLCASVCFLVIMFRVLGEWCPWCLVTHVLNAGIAICMALMWPRRPSEAHAGPLYAGPVVAPQSAAPLQPLVASVGPLPDPWATFPHPSGRLLAVTLLGIVILNISHMNAMGLKKAQSEGTALVQNFNACMGKLQPFLADVEQRVRDWEAGKKYAIEIRPDDPVRTQPAADGSGPAPLDVVVFSDFECPMCGKFATFFDEQVPRLFGGHIREIFKHYPLDQTCNPKVGVTMHKHACEAMRMAEAARTLKGNTGFWQAHDYVYKHQNELKQGKLKPDAVASAIGVDVGQFATAMSSADIQTRVNGNAEQARVCEIRGTPSVFVDGKPVDSMIAEEIGFWDKLADWYWKKANLPRPADTMLRAAAPALTTPGSPGSKASP